MSRLAGKMFGGPGEQPVLGMEQTGPAQYPDQARMPETYPMGGVPEAPRYAPVEGSPSPVAPVPTTGAPPIQVGQLSQPQVGGIGERQRFEVDRQRLEDQRIARDRADEAAVSRRQQHVSSSQYATF